MNEKTRYLTEGVRKFSPLLHTFEAGFTIEQVRTAVYEALQPEFRNPEVLARYGIDLLTVEATNISKLKLSPSSYDLFRSCMKLRKSLLDHDQDGCARICSEWEQDIGAGLRFYWNAARLEVNKTDLSLDEFAYEAFRNIGSLLEATMLPYLREMAHLQSSLRGENLNKEEIAALDFGSVVNRLEGQLGASSLRPQPWNVALNQWRNIAQHFAVKSGTELVECQYGKKTVRTLLLTRDELWSALLAIFSIHLAIRTSHTLFFLDYGDVLAVHCKGFERKDSDLQFQFVVGAASQGFEVTSLSVAPEFSEAVLRDCTEAEPTARGIHASQFLLSLWQATKAEKLSIEYVTKAGTRHLVATTLGSHCALVASGAEEMQYLAKVVNISLTTSDEA